jgi:hypothetical protein
MNAELLPWPFFLPFCSDSTSPRLLLAHKIPTQHTSKPSCVIFSCIFPHTLADEIISFFFLTFFHPPSSSQCLVLLSETPTKSWNIVQKGSEDARNEMITQTRVIHLPWRPMREIQRPQRLTTWTLIQRLHCIWLIYPEDFFFVVN